MLWFFYTLYLSLNAYLFLRCMEYIRCFCFVCIRFVSTCGGDNGNYIRKPLSSFKRNFNIFSVSHTHTFNSCCSLSLTQCHQMRWSLFHFIDIYINIVAQKIERMNEQNYCESVCVSFWTICESKIISLIAQAQTNIKDYATTYCVAWYLKIEIRINRSTQWANALQQTRGKKTAMTKSSG